VGSMSRHGRSDCGTEPYFDEAPNHV
jgi:hypothetical protein